MTDVVRTVSPAAPVDRASYPIGFALRDDDGLAVLVITDEPAEQHAHLDITNTSGVDISLDAPGGAASADRHHFEVRFRPGVLSSVSEQRLRLAEQDGWSATPPQRLADGTVSVFLLCGAGLDLRADTTVRLRLLEISADGTGGARGTQVELRMRGLTYADGTPVVDTKLCHLDLVNQRGRKYVPLHVGFVGGHTVLNDGRTANTLVLRITNASTAPLPLNSAGSAAPSKFVISFDTGRNWGLTTTDALQAATIDAIDGERLDEADWDVAPGRQLGKELAWTLTHHKDDATLAAGQVIQVRIGNIVTALPAGDTNLYLRYENIPGYWDGQFICTVEKAPLRYDEQGNVSINGNVGIGLRRAPATALEVNGGIRSTMWQVLTPFQNDSGPLPLQSAEFTSGGGTLVLLVTGSASRRTPGLVGLRVTIDGGPVGEFGLPISVANQRVPLSGTLTRTGVAAGPHRLTISNHSDAPDMLTGNADSFSLTLLELPF
jgi:hypothetical protein